MFITRVKGLASLGGQDGRYLSLFYYYCMGMASPEGKIGLGPSAWRFSSVVCGEFGLALGNVQIPLHFNLGAILSRSVSWGHKQIWVERSRWDCVLVVGQIWRRDWHGGAHHIIGVLMNLCWRSWGGCSRQYVGPTNGAITHSDIFILRWWRCFLFRDRNC